MKKPSNDARRDADYMALALAQARLAAAAGEVPVGAVVVQRGPSPEQDRVLAHAHNQPIGRCDPTAHAEILALRQAAEAIGNYRLDGCELFVTLEPCAMCAQALLHARVARVVYGAREPRTGAAGSVIDVLGHAALNHQTQVEGGVEADASGELLQTFFAAQRQRAKREAVPLRQDALRTPEAAFEPIWTPFAHWRNHSRWTSEGDALGGLRLHVMDLLPFDDTAAGHVWVALHGPDGWWPQWAEWAARQVAMGHRVCLPDLIGCGMSDKPKKAAWHRIDRHAEVLAGWIEREIAAPHVHLISVPEQARLAEATAERLAHRVVTVDRTPADATANLPGNWRTLPYPDAGHRAALAAWPWPDR